jgi:hypothetical protein
MGLELGKCYVAACTVSLASARVVAGLAPVGSHCPLSRAKQSKSGRDESPTARDGGAKGSFAMKARGPYTAQVDACTARGADS